MERACLYLYKSDHLKLIVQKFLHLTCHFQCKSYDMVICDALEGCISNLITDTELFPFEIAKYIYWKSVLQALK